MPVYSNSRLAAYEACPQQYKLKYIDRVELPEGEETIEAFLGSRVHKVLEKLHKELILTKLNTLESLLQYYKDEWDRNWNDNVLIVREEFSKEHYENTGKEAITNYYKRHYPFDQSKTLATEHMLRFKIEDYSITGFIDRLSHKEKGVYEIHDYKTSGTLPSQDRLDNDRQLALYQIGIKEKFRDARDIRLIWHYLVFDKEFTSTRSDAQLRDLKKEVVSLIKTIEKDTKFEPTESRLCDWCDYPEYCPAKKHEIKVQYLPPNKYLKEKGVILVNRYASTKAKMKALKEEEEELQIELNLIEEAAVKYAHNEGVTSITGSDHVLRINEEQTLKFPLAKDEDREELERYIKKVGIWQDVSGLNLPRLIKLAQSEDISKKIRDRLLDFAEEITKTSVRLAKKKADEEE